MVTCHSDRVKQKLAEPSAMAVPELDDFAVYQEHVPINAIPPHFKLAWLRASPRRRDEYLRATRAPQVALSALHPAITAPGPRQ